MRDRSRARIAPAPAAVWRFRRISRDCASFFRSLAIAEVPSGFRYSIIRLFCAVFILLRCTLIILLRCTIFILLCRERTGPARLEVRPRTPPQMASLAIFDYRRL